MNIGSVVLVVITLSRCSVCKTIPCYSCLWTSASRRYECDTGECQGTYCQLTYSFMPDGASPFLGAKEILSKECVENADGRDACLRVVEGDNVNVVCVCRQPFCNTLINMDPLIVNAYGLNASIAAKFPSVPPSPNFDPRTSVVNDESVPSPVLPAAGWCPTSLYLPDIRFVYEETEDAEYYLSKYGMGKDAFVVQSPNAAALFAGNQIPQQQARPQQDRPPTITPSTSRKTAPLAIWKLQLPRSAYHVYVLPLREDGINSASLFQVTPDDLRNPALTLVDTESDYTMHVDVTSQAIRAGQWYAVCANNSVIRDGVNVACQQCTLLKACNKTYACYNKAYSMIVDEQQATTQSVDVLYRIRDLPVSAFITTEAFLSYEDNRCRSKLPVTPVDSKRYMAVPNTVMEVHMNNLNARWPYSVRSTLEFSTGLALDGVPSAVVVADYLRVEGKDSVFKCEKTWELGDQSKTNDANH